MHSSASHSGRNRLTHPSRGLQAHIWPSGRLFPPASLSAPATGSARLSAGTQSGRARAGRQAWPVSACLALSAMAAATAASQRDPAGDWQDFSGFQPPAAEADRPEPPAAPTGEGGPWDDGGGGDLGTKLPLCFEPPRYGEGGGAHLPLRPLGEQTVLQEDEIWNALTDNYGNVMPVDWKSSHTRSLHLPTLNLSEKGVSIELVFQIETMEQKP
ncbi:fasciculation and elongation protein zeta-2-like [Sphaerodactylus townsendi]|uniref:fasciculation and elongation protein zeta-2-like n=1 Tax=Sphaerodactylus townsendi TaxID=933632 RepID=UPI0020275358|nr:fasciculation and elongation protein zeta-2-like [Sphaerodactylus townsendi]